MEPTDGPGVVGGLISLVPIIIIFLLVVPPYWKIWKRTGHSGWWGLLVLVPLVNIISLWVLAFEEWPALHDRGPRP